MESSGRPAGSDEKPHPKIIEILSVFIAILTLTLPLYTVSLYSASSPVAAEGVIARRAALPLRRE